MTKRPNYRELTVSDAEHLIESGRATGGMIPKLQNLIALLRRGLRSAHVIGGSKEMLCCRKYLLTKGQERC